MHSIRIATLAGIGVVIVLLSLAGARQDPPPPEHRTATATRYELIGPRGDVVLVVHSAEDEPDTLVLRDARGSRLATASSDEVAGIFRVPGKLSALDDLLESVRSSAQLTRQRTDALDQRVRTLEQMRIDPADQRDAAALIRELQRQIEMNEREMQRMQSNLDRNDRTIRDLEFRVRDLERRVP